jgi:hypothetical protein
MSAATARRLVYERSGGLCEIAIRGVCLGRATNWHHRRRPGRIWVPSNGLHLCGSGTTGCHGWVTEHPQLSYPMGWALHSWQDPLWEPAVIRGRSCYLTDSGLYVPCREKPRQEQPRRGFQEPSL